MAEEHGVFGPALIRAELLSQASVLGRHQLLGHRVAVGAGLTVFAPAFRQVMSKEELTAWEKREETCLIVRINSSIKDSQGSAGCDSPIMHRSWRSVSLPSLQKKQSLLLILRASLVIFSVLQYSHRDVTKLAFLNS